MNLERIISRYFTKYPKALFRCSIIFSLTLHALLMIHVTSVKFSNKTNQTSKIAKVCITMNNVSIHRKEKSFLKKQKEIPKERESVEKQECIVKEFEKNTGKDQAEQEESAQPMSASGKIIEKTILDYMNEIYKRIYAAKRYPSYAKRMNQKGIVRVKFVLSKNGTLKGDVNIIKACRYKDLNDASVNTIIKASPYPQFPSELKKDEMSFTIDLAFCLGDR